MIDADGHRIRSELTTIDGIAGEHPGLNRKQALNVRHHGRRAMAGAVMTSTLVARKRVLMLNRTFGLRHRMRTDFIAIAAQRQQGEKNGKNSGAQKTHGRQH